MQYIGFTKNRVQAKCVYENVSICHLVTNHLPLTYKRPCSFFTNYSYTLLRLTPPTEGFHWNDLRKFLHGGQRMPIRQPTKWQRNIAESFNPYAHKRYRWQTYNRRTCDSKDPNVARCSDLLVKLSPLTAGASINSLVQGEPLNSKPKFGLKTVAARRGEAKGSMRPWWHCASEWVSM